MIVNVVRLPGDNPAAEPLVDESMTAVHIATVKGRCYIDKEGTDKEETSVSAPLRGVPNLGSIAEIHDAELGDSYRGKVMGVTVNVDGKDGVPKVQATYKVERPV